MNVYRIYILILDLFYFTPLLMIDKKGEKDFEFIYAYLCFCIYWVYASYVLQNGENVFESLNKKGEKVFGKRTFDLFMFLSPYWCIYVCLVLCALLPYLFVYCYAWVKGELLWSLTLIHAYITPWVLSSSKRGRLLAQRPITLVLMMINSCCYSTNDLVFNSFRYLIKILVGI